MTTVTDSGTTEEEEEEGVEALEAEHVYILMKKEYRISRNVRAEWYLRRINSIITFPRREKLSESEEELEVVSVIPLDVPLEWDYDTSHLYKYRITHRTTLHFLARKYRLVVCLDLSPSASVVDVTKGSVVLDEVFTTLKKCLKGIVRPFYVPGSQLLFQPEVYLTIIAHTPFFKSQSQQVLVQGWLLMVCNLDEFLNSIQIKLTKIEDQLAEATGQTYNQMDITREKRELGRERMTEEAIFLGPTTLTNPMVSPDIGFVDMLRYGIVALQLLPENSSAGIVVITDGVISLPDATVFDSLLVQLRNQTIACSFLQLGSVYHPQASLGYVPFSDLMNFLATATCGAYLATLPPIGEDYNYDMNDYHKSLLSWGFQKIMRGLCPDSGYNGMNGFSNFLPVAQEATALMRKKERETQLNTTLNAVLSCRLREGYAIKQVTITEDQIQLVLVLPWKYSIFIEYHIRAAWPPTQSTVSTEVWIEATYEFLNDVTSDVHRQFRSKYRQSMVAKYWSTLQHLRDTDMLLVGLQSFASNPTYYIIPDCIKRGHPVFYRNPGHISSISDATRDQFPQFTTFWKPVCMLDSNIWQKWMHTHRIGVILEHDHPLPKNLHVTSASGRYGIVHCRQAELALTTLLTEWCDFILIENDSYIKFLYREGDQEKPPVSFFVVRITSKPPPCLVIRLAFLGGTPGHIRNQMVAHICEKIQGLTFPSRMGLTERSKSLPPSIHQPQDKVGEDMSISVSSDLRQGGVRPVLTRVASNIPCCVITHKPIEKILIWYDKMPSNLLSSIVLETPVCSSIKSLYTKLGATKSATHNMALLSRYLHHRRWIWAVQAPSVPSVSLNAVARILNTLTRIRLQEGFNFAYACNGMITMVREFDMKLELNENDGEGLLESCAEGGLATFPCVAQYVIFPPHITNCSRDSIVDEDWEEGDSVEADGEMQIVTECWVEPQNGVVTSLSPHALHLHNCNYRQLAQAFFPVDRKCIWGLLTVEHLLLMCQGSSGIGVEGHGVTEAHHPAEEASADPPPRVVQVPFSFDLIRLLPMCQQVELLISTYIQDLFTSLVKRVTFDCENSVDEANQILYSLLLDHLCQLHHNREFHLSVADMEALPTVLQERQRSSTTPPSPFSNTNISKMTDPPKWRCFLKSVSHNHLLITLLPASYHDLKLLLVKRANITETSNMALKLVPDSENVLDLDTETNTTDQPLGGPVSEQQISLESSTSSLTHLTSPSLPPPTPTSSRSATMSPGEVGEQTPSRVRYKSGPVSHTNSQPVQSVFSDSVLRERASSFHVSRERCSSFGQGAGGAERNRTGSVDSPTKEPQYDAPEITSPSEHVRKRYISMPSKSHIGTFEPATKSMSAEGLRSEEGCVPLHLQAAGGTGETDSVRRVSSIDESNSVVQPPPSHRPLFGAVTLPIYVYDCKLSSITAQLINSDSRSSVVGKDLYVDSTSKLESDIIEDTVPLKDDSVPATSNLQEDLKQPSPEPRSEESDVGDSSCLRAHVDALEVLYLRSFVLGVFQALQRELSVHAHDIQAALDHCHEAVMEIDITNFLQTICGHLRDFRLRIDLEYMHQCQPEVSGSVIDPPNQGTAVHKGEKKDMAGETADATVVKSSSASSSNRFPLSLLKFHHPCQDLQQLHSSIRERFMTILQGSFCPVPSLPDYYFFSPQTLHQSSEGTPVGDFIYVSSQELEQWEKNQIDLTRHRKLRRISVSKKSDVFTEGEEDPDDENTVNGGDEEEEDDDDDDEDHDKSIEFRSEIGSTVYHRLHSQLTALDGDEDKTSVISERDEDLSTVPDNLDLTDGPIPPLFLHLTCTVRLAGHVQPTISMKTVPTCLDEIVQSLSGSEVDLSTVSVTLDVLCMTLPPALASKTAVELVASSVDLRSARTTSWCSTASPQLKRGRSVSESTCASLSDMDESYLEDEDQLGHLPNYQHQAIVATVDEIKWLLRDEIASAMLHMYPLTEQTLEMVAAHVESSRQARNCICESIPLNFVCGMEQSRDKFMQEFGRLSLSGHHLKQEGSLYYLVQDKTQMRRRHFSSLVPPLGIKNQFLIVRPQPHADDTAQLRQMDSGCQVNKVSLSSPDVLKSPSNRLQATRVSFDTERCLPECLGESENNTQRVEGSEKEKWVRRRERKERRDSERRGSINTSDSDSDISQVRSHFSRESSHQSHDGRIRSSESPKKSNTLSSTLSSKKSHEARGAEEQEEEDNCDTMKEYMQSPENSFPESSSVHDKHRDKVAELGLSGEASQIDDSVMEQKDKGKGEEIQFPVEDILPDSRTNSVKDSIMEPKEGRSEGQPLEKLASPEDLSVNVDRNEGNKNQEFSNNELQVQKSCRDAESARSSPAEKVTTNDELVVEKDVASNVSAKVSPHGEKDAALLDMQKPAKDPAHRLSLPLNELIRCGSESLPRPSVSAEVIRKSASTDSFVPCITEASVEQLRTTPSSAMTTSGSSCGLWAEFIKSRHSSSELMKSRNNSGTSADLLKSRHNSGTGGDLKSRHNSGTGSVPGGPHSDVSSLLESGQTTEDGCEGDISDSDNECCDWLQDFESVRPFLPEFWLILRVSNDRVDTFFHSRTEAEMARWRGVQAEVVRSVRSLVKLVNQTLLLQELHNTRMCNHLLEPETSDEIWRHEDSKGRSVDDNDLEYRGYLEASFRFKAGAFACRIVWETKFELHPKLKLCAGKVGSKGIQALRTILNPFSVNNRKNMFVYEDSSGNGSNVFYLRLKEHQYTSVSPQVDGRRDETGLSRSSSVVSLGKRGSREDDPLSMKTVCTPQHYELRPRVSSFGEKDVIMEGVPSTLAQRKRNHYIILTVHGIAEPGPAIKEELVRMLQNRLDEAVVEAICLMLWSNPQHKLTSEDVHFIQPPYQPPKTVLRFTVNAHALPYLQAVGYYLRQNMLSCGFIHPKFADNCPEHHFQDFSATDQDLSSEPNIFLFVRPRKSAAKGIACIAFSVVDGSGCIVQHISCPRPSQHAYQEVFSKQDFEALTHTQEYQPSPSKSPGPMAMLQFKLWESGRVDLDEVRRYLVDSTRHALWDVNTEYRLLTAPIMPSLPVQQHTTPASEPSTPKKGPAVRSVSMLEKGTQPTEDRTRSVSISGVPPHVCLPRMANKFGSKRMVHPNDGREDSHRERAPSPLNLVQARLRLMSNSVPDLKLRGRRASLQSPWNNTTGSEGAPTSIGHSPLKVRHSLDLGVDRNKLLTEEGHATPLESQPWEYTGSTPNILHPVFHGLMLDWLEYASELDEKGEHAVRRELGEKGGEHAVKKHTVHITTRHAVPIFISELQKWVSQHSSDTSTKIFEETSTEGEVPVYKLVEPSKIPQVVKSDPKGGYVHNNFIIIGRNNQQWWATLFEENFNDYYISMITSSKNSQRYHPLVVSPRGRCVSGGELSYTRMDNSSAISAINTPSAVPQSGTTSSVPSGGNVTSSAVTISSPVTVPSTPTSLSSAMGPLWSYETSDVLFIPRQKFLLATLCGLELVIHTYNWTKEQCDNLHSAMTRLGQWSTARNRLLSTIALQKMGLYHNQPFVWKDSKKKEEDSNPYIGNPAFVDGLIKLQAPGRDVTVNIDRGNRRAQGMLSVPGLTDIYRESRPPRTLKNSHYGNLKDLELRHGTQMTEIRRLVLQKENQRRVLLKTVVQTHGHSSPVFNDKILALYKQNARIVHFCYTPLLFLPRWRWQVAAARDHSLVNPHSPVDRMITFGIKTPEPRSRHDSGSSVKGVSGSGPTDLRRTLSFKSNLSSPSQRRRHVTGGDEKWHDALCSSYIKEYIQYLQSLGFLMLNVTHAPQQRGRSNGRESENRGVHVKEVRFNEQVTKESTYLLKNVLGGTILLEIFFSEPYFSAKIYVLESCRLEGKKLSSQNEEVSKVVIGGPPPGMQPSALSSAPPIFPEGCPPDQIDDKFAINSFLDKVDDIKVLLHMHSFTYDFHLRALCAYVANRQLLFTPGYHLSSCLSDFIKYYNKGPNFARNLIHSGELTVEDTGTPGEQLYNYVLAREKQYRMRVLRMTPVIPDPDAVMQYTEFILVHTKTCRVHYKDANDQKVSDDYDVTLLVSHNTSADTQEENLHPNILHLNFYVILTSTREMYPNRILEKKMGRFRTVSIAPSIGRRWTSSSTQTAENSDHSSSGTPPVAVAEDAPPPGNDIVPPLRSYIGIRSESVNYLGYYTQYEETMQMTLETQAVEARTRIHHIFNQAKIHCRRDSLWQRLTASLREEERQKLPRDQILSGLSFSELSELLSLVSVESLSSVDPQLLPLLSKPLQWYQGLTRVLQAKYQERHRSLTSSDGNIQHVVVLSSTCSDAFMMLSINLHHQKAELCCVNKQLKGEGTAQNFTDNRVQALIQDFVNACCFHLWCGLL